jgi:hypothetical protein
VDVRSLGAAAYRRWHGCWTRRGSRTHAPHANAIVWHQPARSGHLHSRTGCPGCRSGAGKLPAGAPYRCCRSRRSASSRIIGQRGSVVVTRLPEAPIAIGIGNDMSVCRDSFLRIGPPLLQISAGNMHSIRNSCAVMSCGKPTVDIIEKYEILSLP